MYITGIGTATPDKRYDKAECLAAFEQSEWFARLDTHSHLIARTVLRRENGIDTRHLAIDSIDDVFKIDPDTLSRRFHDNAPLLAASAGERALRDAHIASGDIDAVVVSTCTGYLCPGLSGYVVERLGLREGVRAYDLVGQGCAAAIPNLQMGAALLSGGGMKHILSICVEVSSAAMYLDDDPGVLISACLFGDGAGAVVLSAEPLDAGERSSSTVNRQIRWCDTESLIDPGQRKALMFEQCSGMLRNILTRSVPSLTGVYAERVLDTVLNRAQLSRTDIGEWILHAGGRDVLQVIEKRFELQPQDLRYSASMLRAYGNLSSAFVYFVLETALADGAEGGWWWMSGFGAGFSCHGALLEVQ